MKLVRSHEKVLDHHGTFYVYAFLALLGLVFVALVLHNGADDDGVEDNET
jgi:hypothetical protein